MVKLDKIYTKAGDSGKTRLSTGEPVDKWHPRVTAYGTVDETNAALGVAALHADGDMLTAIRRIQNDLFDLSYCTSEEQAADIFTKFFVSKDKWQRALLLIGILTDPKLLSSLVRAKQTN